ncbi:MAG: AMP-binding protein [Bryobacteraceae bacterium]
MSTQTASPKPARSSAPLPLEAQIVSVVRELLVEQGRGKTAESATPKSSFQHELGLSSLDLVEVVVRCEARLEIEIPDEIAETADTANAWAKAIREGNEKASAKSAYRIAPPSGVAAAAPANARNLIEVLEWHADAGHGRVHAHVLEGGSGRGVTADQLLQASTRVARGLISLGLVRNDTVAILLASGSDFFEAFFGVILAGGTPVPVYPPHDLDAIGEYVRQQTRTLRDAGIRFLITFGEAAAVTRLLRINVPTLIESTTVAELRELGTHTSARFPDPSEIALIQYTSGTTGEPKGVMLRHEQLLANIRAIGKAIGVRSDDAVVSWLPLASDLGLVGCWLFSLYHGTPLTLLSPADFLERPESWLWAIHDSRGTLSAAPNFAYELCTRRIPMWTLEGIDLSSWRVAVNAGETVLADTVKRFSERFAPLGFRSEAMTPAYGLSENGVALAMMEPGRAAASARGFLSVGKPIEGVEVRIDAEAGSEIGRLLFRGTARAAGYVNEKPWAAEEWTDTGDLAFLQAGEIFFAGRAKDVLVIEGRVTSPEPIEHAILEVPGVKAAAVVGVSDQAAGTERLTVIAESGAESETGRARVIASIEEAVRRSAGQSPALVRIIAPGTLPRTANRKLRRIEAGRMFANGELGLEASPPGVQMAGLWWENAGPLGSNAAVRVVRGLAATARTATARAAAAAGASAPAVLSILGRRPMREGTQMRGPVVIVSHRCTQMDALSIASLVEGEYRLAGEETLLGLPDWAARLLRPQVVRTREQMERALRDKEALVVLPDSPLGTPVLRSRYRMSAFEAAIATGAPLLPFGMQIIRNKLFFRVSEKLAPAGRDARELRGEVRKAIRAIYA